MKKRLMSIVLSVALVFGISAPAMGSISPTAIKSTLQLALLSEDTKAAIITALQNVENDKEAFDLGEVDFTDLYVGNRIQAYEYVESGLKELYHAFPLLYDNKVVALAIGVRNGKYQITTAFVDEVNNASAKSISLIYDAHAVYLFDGEDFTLLGENTTAVLGRESFENELPNVSGIQVSLCDLEKTEKLEYVSLKAARAQTYYSCGVKYVPQGDKENICWAATVACINNYVNKMNLTAIQVAQDKFGPMKYNIKLDTDKVADFMKAKYNLNYTYKAYAPSELVMLKNIQSGHPIYGKFFSTGNTNHGVTIYGINIVSGYITVMDPAFGSTTAYANYVEGSGSIYSYVNPNNGAEFGLINAICATWQS